MEEKRAGREDETEKNKKETNITRIGCQLFAASSCFCPSIGWKCLVLIFGMSFRWVVIYATGERSLLHVCMHPYMCMLACMQMHACITRHVVWLLFSPRSFHIRPFGREMRPELTGHMGATRFDWSLKHQHQHSTRAVHLGILYYFWIARQLG